MKNKKRSGVTLVELMIAVLILVIAIVPIYNMYMTSIKTNALAHKITIATFTAQQKIEEFVGLEIDEVENKIPRGFEKTNEEFPSDKFNGFQISYWYSPYEDSDGSEIDGKEGSGSGTDTSTSLYKINVTVYDSDGTSVLCTQSDVINVARGGIV